MSKTNRRNRRISEYLQQELAQCFQTSAREPWFYQVTVTKVDLSPDLKSATIFYTLMDESLKETVKEELANKAGFFRTELAHRCDLRYTPKLRFQYDDILREGERLSKLIDDLGVSEE
ncbi:MAG TPA: 30S ribosome-binding factor RbfA [Coxiellaceae bacterium]|nr:30S ribosome-binding factor RbfA [Coxiellaceae bacterium]